MCLLVKELQPSLTQQFVKKLCHLLICVHGSMNFPFFLGCSAQLSNSCISVKSLFRLRCNMRLKLWNSYLCNKTTSLGLKKTPWLWSNSQKMTSYVLCKPLFLDLWWKTSWGQAKMRRRIHKDLRKDNHSAQRIRLHLHWATWVCHVKWQCHENGLRPTHHVMLLFLVVNISQKICATGLGPR